MVQQSKEFMAGNPGKPFCLSRSFGNTELAPLDKEAEGSSIFLKTQLQYVEKGNINTSGYLKDFFIFFHAYKTTSLIF